jgi:hypothetical protein
MSRTRMALSLVLMFSISQLAMAASLDGFNKRFKLHRDAEGKLTAVKMQLFTQKFSLRPYLEQIKNDLKEEIARMKKADKAVVEAEIEALIHEMVEMSDKSNEAYENSLVLKDALLNLPNINVDASFAEIQKHDVLRTFEFDLKKALKMLDLAIIADPTDARYFYRKNVTYEVVKRAIEFAKKKFDNVPVLNLISFVIVKVHDLVLEQRLFNQNMLLHYLENFNEKDLGLSKEEADFVFSSIYESRIAATNYPESNAAANNWARYGTDKFFAMVRMGNNKIRRGDYQFEAIGPKYNWGFVEVKENGEKVVKNLVNNAHMFSSKMATAYNYNQPNKIKRNRALLNLGQVGLGFLPISGWIKSMVTGFVESFYVEQKLTEGALVAYFESNGNQAMFQAIMKQNINPYLVY